MSVTKRKAINIYVHDADLLYSLTEEIRFLWFKKFGIRLTNSDIFTTSLIYTRDGLKKEEEITIASNPSRNNITLKYDRLD